MHFRRELDFDDLIETIDQLADEEIDEVVDWQLTQSPAAKQERTGASVRTPGLGPSWTSRIAEAAANAMNEVLATVATPSPVRGGREPQWLQNLQDATNAYTMQQLIEMRNRAWRDGNRDAALGIERRIQDQSRPLRRTELQPRGQLDISSLWENDPSQTGRELQRIRYRRISWDVSTMREPIYNRFSVRLWWSEDGGVNRQYQQAAVSEDAVRALSRPTPLLRAAIDPERAIIVEVDPRRVDWLAVYMESPS